MKKFIVILILASILIFTSIVLNGETQKLPPEKVVEPLASDVHTPSPAESFDEWMKNNGWYPELPNNTYSGTISDLYTQDGKQSLRFELRKSDQNVHGSKRSEISALKREQPLEEHTYTFSTLLPEGGDEDYSNDLEGDEIIAQWQNVPDPDEKWRMPSLALYTGNAGSYVLQRVWDESKISTDEAIKKKGNFVRYRLGSFLNDKGKFVTWKFHVKWGWLASQKPILEVYKDGVKILDLDGYPNTTNDEVGVYMKLGIFKWNWAQPNDLSKLTKRVVYFNNVSIQ